MGELSPSDADEFIRQCHERRKRKSASEQLYGSIRKELDRAYAKHGQTPWSRHEFYGIIKEEFDELWADIKSDAPQEQLLKELVQVAAMCFRYFETGDKSRGPHPILEAK